ncbi:MAG: hypothetical protein R3B48_11765 [Kofleriaceae bacterium]
MKRPRARLYSQVLVAPVLGANLLLALREDVGAPVLAGWQDVDGAWVPGALLPSPKLGFRMLAAAAPPDGPLQVLALDGDGSAYLVAKQDGVGPRFAIGHKLEQVERTFQLLAAAPGADRTLQVVGLAADTELYDLARLDQKGNWKKGDLITTLDAPIAQLLLGAPQDGKLHVLGLDLGGDLHVLAVQRDTGSWDVRARALTQGAGVSYAFTATGSDGSLQVLGLAGGLPAVFAQKPPHADWQAGQSLAASSAQPGALRAMAAAAFGASGATTLAVVGLEAGTGAPVLVASHASGAWTVLGTALPNAGAVNYFLAAASSLGGDALFAGLTSSDGKPRMVAIGTASGWTGGRALPEQPPEPARLAVRIASFANPDVDEGQRVASDVRPGDLSLTPQGALAYVYPSSSSQDGGFMPLWFATTSQIESYAIAGVEQKWSGIDLSSGWSNAALEELLVGGRANQDPRALWVKYAPARAVWNGFSFYFWVSRDDRRVYAAFLNQGGSWSALIELYQRTGANGNGTDPVVSSDEETGPVAYAFGDLLYVVVPTGDGLDLEVHVFDPGDINYTEQNNSQSIFVNYQGERQREVKPGRTTWIRADHVVVPGAALPGVARAGSGAARRLSRLSGCVNVALARKAYLVLAMRIEGVPGRSSLLLPLDGSTGLPDQPRSGRDILEITGSPAGTSDEVESLAQVPTARVRMVNVRGGSPQTILVRYLDAGASIQTGEGEPGDVGDPDASEVDAPEGSRGRVVFANPRWVDDPADPTFDLPGEAQTTSAGVAQAVVYTEPYLDPDAGDDLPEDAPTLANVFTALVLSIAPAATSASRTADKRGTVYLTRRLGTAVQTRSPATARELLDPRAGADGEGPGTGLAVNVIMDGPLPVPGNNVDQLVGGFLGTPFARILLGTTRTERSTIDYNRFYGNGIKTSTMISLGWTTGFSAGIPLMEDKTTSSYTVSAILKGAFMVGAIQGWQKLRTQTAQSNFIGSAALMASGDPATARLANSGALFALQPSLEVTQFRFRDLNDKLDSPDAIPFTAALGPGAQVVKVITPLSVTAGDLASYSRASINQAMKDQLAAFQRKDARWSRYFDQDDYDDYVTRVIERHAVTLGSGKRFLEIAWSNSGIYEETSDQVDEAVRSSGWQYNWELEAGVGFNYKYENESSMGLLSDKSISKFSFEVKLEALYWRRDEIKQVASQASAQRFGLSVDLSGLRAGVNPGDVRAYTMRVYLLQPSTQWVKEAHFLGGVDRLNLTSEPWKIMCVVDPSTVDEVR